MDSSTLISMVLPEGILDYFEITSFSKSEDGFKIHLAEKNIPPEEFAADKLTSKGFFDEITVQDFPIRNLVLCQFTIVGYNRFNFILAS